MSANSSIENNGRRKSELRLALLSTQPLSNILSGSQGRRDGSVLPRMLKLHLELCTQLIYDFNDEQSYVEEKEKKRNILIGLVDFLSLQNLNQTLPERLLPDIVRMISANLFRSLPVGTHIFSIECIPNRLC